MQELYSQIAAAANRADIWCGSVHLPALRPDLLDLMFSLLKNVFRRECVEEAKGVAEFSVLCPRCGARNEIVAMDVPGGERINCSRCKADMGRLDRLQMQSDEPRLEASKSKPPI
jgi:hypothetical protein